MQKMRQFALAGVLAVGLAACGSDEPGGGQGGAGDGEAPRYGYGAPPAAATIETGDTDLGAIVTDADGLTLYMFGADKDGKSTCYDDCAATWPALVVEGEPEAGDGLDAQLGTTERTDGTSQVTYAGQPLYYFASDAAPGDTNGQGISDIWFVVSPEGKPIS